MKPTEAIAMYTIAVAGSCFWASPVPWISSALPLLLCFPLTADARNAGGHFVDAAKFARVSFGSGPRPESALVALQVLRPARSDANPRQLSGYWTAPDGDYRMGVCHCGCGVPGDSVCGRMGGRTGMR